ncbi:MAG TPA: phenylalanine--tRNA ligase subunit beta [Candidatus Baltobacteraceae bacterium]|jgi:phenylalanyl-tRNA synthetase beta chain|nr:phenylalanine--tRNA ligase subunit beta [Candidatus Baltobacteraceae bacterium]
MKLSIAWLRDYLDLNLPVDEIVERLALLGFPVDGVEHRPRVNGIVVGRILSIEAHPNADRLRICRIDVGCAEPLGIATAAANVAENQVVPVATIGAHVASEPVNGQRALQRIDPRKMRGFESQGMLCSAAELGLEGTWFEDGILQLDQDTPLGSDVVELFHLHDPVLDVDVTPNRVDAMCVVGLARELAAALHLPLREPTLSRQTENAPPTSADLRVSLLSADCSHFVAQRFSGLRVGIAPAWMRIRLALSGQRPINNLVDISNFVMLELGQPLHFYDYERLAGRHLIARDARDGEIVRTLDGVDHRVTSAALVIADEERAQGFAGLKGGAFSEVTTATRELALESATFVGTRVRRMSLALGFRTDASTRHEKSIPPALNALGAARASYLLQKQGAIAHAPLETGKPIPTAAAITLRSSAVRNLLGFAVTTEETTRTLTALGFRVTATSGRDLREMTFSVIPPPWRADVTIPVDVIEEIGRTIGYDRITAELPPLVEQSISSAEYVRERRVADALATLGYREIVPLALESAGVAMRFERAGLLPPPVVEIRNPLSEDQRFLRFSLLAGLLALVAKNERETHIARFEIGHVFADGDPDPHERVLVTWILVRPPHEEPPWQDEGFRISLGHATTLLRTLTGKDAAVRPGQSFGLHPGKTAELSIDERVLAHVGVLDPRLAAEYDLGNRRVYLGTIDLALLPDPVLPRYREPSKYPAVERDLALVVGRDVPAAEVIAAIRASANGTLADAHVFDDYRGGQVPSEKKSIAVRIVLQRDDATLTDTEADSYVASILDALHKRMGAVIRS